MVYEHYNRPSRQDMIAVLFMVASWIGVVSAGAVGECRSECVEQNLYKIVRVHLKDDFVMAGICRNTSVSAGALSTVIPFICNRHHGIWTLDTEHGFCTITGNEDGYG
ncbi:hypothetical protein Aduo_005434 [Ancylostoma duodenale]